MDGKDLTQLPLTERKQLLQHVMPKDTSVIKLSEVFDANGVEFFKLAEKMNLEGIMAKKADSVYLPRSRSKDWLKVKTEKRQELVIGGYTKNEGTSKLFSALLLGWFENKVFHFPIEFLKIFQCPELTNFQVTVQLYIHH